MGTSEGFTPDSPVDPGPSRSAPLCFAVAVDVHMHRMRRVSSSVRLIMPTPMEKSSSLSEGGSGRDAGD